jgi:mRNA-degrading endonuclease toxin of MazEF toxin-antitoxin module
MLDGPKGVVFPHERGEFAEAPAPEKERPVLILQIDADTGNDRYPLVLGAPLTTQKTDRVYQQDLFLPAGEANLAHDSKVLLGLTQPFLKTRLGRTVGRLSAPSMAQVEAKLLRLLGLRPTPSDSRSAVGSP